MGYKRPLKVYDLQWPDEPGLEVAMRAAPVGLLLDVQDLADKADDDPKAARAVVEHLGGLLVSWNLEDDDGPVPADAGGLARQDMDFLMKILTGWMQASTSVDTPLPGGSPNGRPSAPEHSIPMEPLSAPHLS